MTSYITLASRTSPTLMPLTRDPDRAVTAFVFSNSDDALAFANQHLQHYDDEWITNTHDKISMGAWLKSCIENDNVTQIAINPNSGNPVVVPIDVFLKVVRTSQ